MGRPQRLDPTRRLCHKQPGQGRSWLVAGPSSPHVLRSRTGTGPRRPQASTRAASLRIQAGGSVRWTASLGNGRLLEAAAPRSLLTRLSTPFAHVTLVSVARFVVQRLIHPSGHVIRLYSLKEWPVLLFNVLPAPLLDQLFHRMGGFGEPEDGSVPRNASP